MTKFNKQVLSVLASTAVALSTPLTAFAGTTLVISGNGSGSENEVKFETESKTTVVQNNTATITNNVDANAKTGGNEANKNTGGTVNIETGDASSNVEVANTVNSNSASVDCCANGDIDVLVEGNGADSENEVKLELENKTKIFQDNVANVTNNVDSNAKTGGNEANKNTGGDVHIHTGDAAASAKVKTTANANWATVGGGGNGSTPELSLRIVGNGADSDNDIELDLDSKVTLTQDNHAYVTNDVDADAKTGKNEANKNTGGDVHIDTGDADTDVTVDNMVNFNWASADCGCLFDLLAKIAENGYESENEIEAELEDKLEAFQDNEANLTNDVDGDAKTGKNEANKNTGEADSDPSIETGDADTTVNVSNSGNANSFGSDVPSDWPEFEWNFNLSLSWEQLLAWLNAQN